ncbi:hypothetical protein GLX27_001616 [Malassezia furfur]|uniref:C3H1-type domain-containing protein n=1 Tax=Malassezia furfur TaxID=55194 RepID=A0ABY8EN57_MALFU|nr:hypothetical protein GLX27_001616 [Malassezia furfur]
MSHAGKAELSARRPDPPPTKPPEAKPPRKSGAAPAADTPAPPLDVVVREAWRTGRISLASRTPPLAAVPEAVWALLDDAAPAWYDAAQEAAHGAWRPRRDVHVLQLGGNALRALDERVAALAQLTRLELHANQLASLPASLGELAQLTTLTLAHNQLAALPMCVLRLRALTTLDVRHNRLEALWTPQQAAEVGDVLPSLRTLDAGHNQLRNGALLRAGGGAVDVLALPRTLRRLDVSDNALQGPLPLQLVAPLTELVELDVAGNELGDAVFAPPPPRADAPPALPRLAVLDVRRAGVASLGALEALFASGAALAPDEARDVQRAAPAPPPHAPSGVAPHVVVRTPTRPSAADAALGAKAVEGHVAPRPAVWVVVDAARGEAPARRKRGGRGRGGDARRDEHDEHAPAAPAADAGSALANAKLSTKKKEALGQVPCKFFRNNGCSAGDACPFAHTLPGEGQAKAVCQWYLKGSCRFGHRCALAHVLPGQPMSMDRKNKRAAQHSAREDKGAPPAAASPPRERRASSAASSAAPPAPAPRGTPLHAPLQGAVFIPHGAPRAAEDAASPPARAHERRGWDGTSGSVDAASAFGTSPFSYPGSHSVFFNANRDADGGAHAFGTTPSYAPWTRGPPAAAAAAADPLSESSHAEDFLPSSLSDLLTPAELERRTRSVREPTLAAGRHVSQSLPSAPDFGLRDLSPPAPGLAPYGLAGRFGARGVPVPGRLGGAPHSVHDASPFLAGVGSPTSVSPPGAVGERSLGVSFGARPDERRRARAYPTYPASPALLPARDDADDTMFELES